MKKFYISPLVSEIEMSVELGFCGSPVGVQVDVRNNVFYDTPEED